MTNTSYKFAAIVLLFGASLVPTNVSNAAYTFQDKTFTSFESYVTYVSEYLKTWRELHGDTEASDDAESAVTTLEVDTRSADMITDDTVRLIGRVDMSRRGEATVWFVYGTNIYRLDQKSAVEVREGTDRSSAVDQKIRDLDSDTRYYYRLVAKDEHGNIVYGALKSFRTAIDPSVQTAAIRVSTVYASNVDEDRATLRARLDWRDNTYMRIWFEYGDEEDDLFEETPHITLRDTSRREYERTVFDLDDRETYYYRAVAEDRQGSRSYGTTLRFTTRYDIENERPKVTLGLARNIERYSATLRGTVDMNDYDNGVAFLVYGEDRGEITEIATRYTDYYRIRENGDDRQLILLDDDLDRFDSYEVRVTGLDLDTQHYYSFGVSYEDDRDETLLLGPVYTFRTLR